MSDELRMILLDGIDGIPILAMISASLLFAFMQWIKSICHGFVIKNGAKRRKDM
ncbi:MAG: hypothetical protein IJA32_00120 [Lachnospiraceae bacterium]|nr:hypothetical protein [Lachnospiraceae bacterium]